MSYADITFIYDLFPSPAPRQNTQDAAQKNSIFSWSDFKFATIEEKYVLLVQTIFVFFSKDSLVIFLPKVFLKKRLNLFNNVPVG